MKFKMKVVLYGSKIILDDSGRPTFLLVINVRKRQASYPKGKYSKSYECEIFWNFME